MKLDVSSFLDFILPVKPYLCILVILQGSK